MPCHAHVFPYFPAFFTLARSNHYTCEASARKRRKISPVSSPVNAPVRWHPSKHPSDKAATGKSAGKLPLLPAAQKRLAPDAISSCIATHGNRRNAPQPRGIRHDRASFGSTLCGGFSHLVALGFHTGISAPGFPLFLTAIPSFAGSAAPITALPCIPPPQPQGLFCHECNARHFRPRWPHLDGRPVD